MNRLLEAVDITPAVIATRKHLQIPDCVVFADGVARDVFSPRPPHRKLKDVL